MIALTDASGQVFAISATGIVPVVKLPQPITALAASPTAHRVAIGAGREVVIVDLGRGGAGSWGAGGTRGLGTCAERRRARRAEDVARAGAGRGAADRRA